MAFIPGYGHVPGTPFHQGVWANQWMGGPLVAAGAIQAANAVANANAMAAATAAASAAAVGAATTRAQYVQALQTHLASIRPAVAANPDASAHLEAAQALTAQLV